MRENYFREGDACKVRGCEFPVFWTEEQLCLNHITKRDLAPPPGDDPLARAGHTGDELEPITPPSPARAGKTKTPKE